MEPQTEPLRRPPPTRQTPTPADLLLNEETPTQPLRGPILPALAPTESSLAPLPPSVPDFIIRLMGLDNPNPTDAVTLPRVPVAKSTAPPQVAPANAPAKSGRESSAAVRTQPLALRGEGEESAGSRSPLAPEATQPPAPAVDVACPRCGQPSLVSPTTLGLCSRCGFCRSLEFDLDALAAVPAPDTTVTPLGRLTALAERIPEWFSILLTGVIVIVAISAIGAQVDLAPLTRAIWGTAQMAVGLLVFALAQWWALVRVAARHPQLGVGDLCVVSGRLWSAAVTELPATRWQVWLGLWGFLLVVCAGFLIGGQGWWLRIG